MTGNIPPLQYIPAGMRTWVTNVERSLQQLNAKIGNRDGLVPVTVTQGIAYAASTASKAQDTAINAQETATNAASDAAIAASQIRAQSIFPNSDFQTGMENWDPSGPNVTWDAGLGRDGVSGAVTLTSPGDGVTATELWSDIVPALPGNSYLVTMWVKPVGTVPAGVFSILQQQTEPGGINPVGDVLYTNDAPLADGVWVQLGPSNTVEIGENYDGVQIGFTLDINTPAALIIDTVSVILATTGRMLVPGALDAYAIRSPDIATSDDPDRIAFNDGGIFQYVDNVLTSYWIPTEFYLADGTITGSDIIGSTITGSVFRTAASGSRVEISGPDPSDPLKKLNINMIGNDPLEVNPGGISFIPSDSISGPDPTITLSTPLMGDGGIGRYITQLSLGSNRRFELDSNFTDTSNPGNNRYTTIYGDPSFLQEISGSVTIQGWNNIYLQYTELDPDTGLPSLDHNRITMNENGTFIAETLYVASASGTETALKMYRDGSANLKLYNGDDRLVINASGGALLGAAGSKLFDWDTNYTYNYGAMYFRSFGGTQTDTSLSRNTLGLKLNNVMVARGFRLTDTSDADTGNRITVNTTAGTVGRMDFIAGTANGFGFVGVVAMGSASVTNQLSVGDSNKYIKPQSDNANNLEIHADSGAVKFIAASGADFAVTTPGGTPGILSQTLYNRTTGSGANVNVASNGTMARSTSSKRFKDKIKDLTLSQAKSLLDLRPVTYQSKCADDDKRRRLVGLIAEEVDEAGVKELVSYEKPGVPDGVTYDRAVPHVILLIKDLYKEIDQLKSQLTAQRAGK